MCNCKDKVKQKLFNANVNVDVLNVGVGVAWFCSVTCGATRAVARLKIWGGGCFPCLPDASYGPGTGCCPVILSACVFMFMSVFVYVFFLMAKLVFMLILHISSTSFLKVYHLYLWTADEKLLKDLWPSVRKATLWLVKNSTEGTGLPLRMTNTYDLLYLEVRLWFRFKI